MPLYPLPSSWCFHVMGTQQESRSGDSPFDFGQLVQSFPSSFLKMKIVFVDLNEEARSKILKRDEFIWE